MTRIGALSRYLVCIAPPLFCGALVRFDCTLIAHVNLRETSSRRCVEARAQLHIDVVL